MLLVAVTDQELLAAQVVKVIFALLILLGTAIQFRQAWRMGRGSQRMFRILLVIVLSALLIPLVRWIHIDNSLLLDPAYTVGTTNGLCVEFARGKGISFQYQVDGLEYSHCQSFHPIPIDSIIISGGKYYVRYSPQFPDKGRIQFKNLAN